LRYSAKRLARYRLLKIICGVQLSVSHDNCRSWMC